MIEHRYTAISDRQTTKTRQKTQDLSHTQGIHNNNRRNKNGTQLLLLILARHGTARHGTATVPECGAWNGTRRRERTKKEGSVRDDDDDNDEIGEIDRRTELVIVSESSLFGTVLSSPSYVPYYSTVQYIASHRIGGTK